MAGTSVGEALARGGLALSSTSETAHRDAQVLLADRMGRPREWLLSHPEAPIPFEDELAFTSGLQRLEAGEPLPYVLGWWEFYGRRFALTPDVLIPRPETELLVEKGLLAIDEDPRLQVAVDLGTGSGCVGITVALERPDLRVIASDISKAASSVARANAIRHGVERRVGFVRADLSAGLQLVDCVLLANLPYVASEGIGYLPFEPRLATEGGDYGPGGHHPPARGIRSPPPDAHHCAAGNRRRARQRAGRAGIRHLPADSDVGGSDLAGRDRILGMRFEEG